MLRNEIQDQMKQAMKSQDKVRLEALRFLWSEMRNAEIDAKHELIDEEIVKIIRREVKKREEAIEQMKKMGRDELVTQELAKLSVLTEYVEEMSVDQIEEMVDGVINGGVNEFGLVMKEVMGLAGGKADGKKVAEMVNSKLKKG